MSRYTFTVHATISLLVTVEADSLAEAVDKARDCPTLDLCHQCGRGQDGTWNTTGELDCDPAGSELTSIAVDDDEIPRSTFKRVAKKWNGARP